MEDGLPAGFGVGEFGVGMDAGDGRVGPSAVVGRPCCDDPIRAAGRAGGGEGRAENFVFVRLFDETFGPFEHDAILDAQVGECFGGAVVEPHFHEDGVARGADMRAETDAVREGAFHLVIAVGEAGPFELLEGRVIGPDGRNVGVGKVGETEVGPERFRNIRDDVTASVPRSEDAQLGFTLRIDGAFEKANARVTPAGIGQDKEGGIFGAGWAVLGGDVEALKRLSDFRAGKAGGCGNFLVGEAVVPDHVLKPKAQLLIAGGFASLVGPRREKGKEREKNDTSTGVEHENSFSQSWRMGKR